jgi:dienelactone hydrolase
VTDAGAPVLRARLAVPTDALGLVVCTHGVAGEHAISFERVVAEGLREAGLATLLVELLTEGEQRDASVLEPAEGIELLGRRLVGATDWARAKVPELRALDVGYLGIAAGAGAALAAAARRPQIVHAVVSAAGRPELAEDSLGDVRAPTLLVVGGLDGEALTVNRETLYFLRCESRLEIVHDATELFDEPDARAAVVRAAARWFLDHLRRPEARPTASA